ncbi:hypothetical protein ACFL21_01350 [Patescibacteria group bacterium]
MSFAQQQANTGRSKLSNLLLELGDCISLEDDDFTKLFYLELKLKSEFGDLARAKEKIFSEFMKVHKTISENPLNYSISINFSNDWKRVDKDHIKDEEYIKKILSEKRSEHETFSQTFCKDVWERLFYGLGEIRNGGVKSMESSIDSCQINAELGKKGGFNELEDVLRARFVAKDFKKLEYAYKRLMTELRESSVLINVKNSFKRLWTDKRGSGDIKPYLAINLKLIILGLPYELQMMTENAELIGKLDHPVRVRRKVKLNEENMNLLNSLSWGSHLLDFRNYLLKI